MKKQRIFPSLLVPILLLAVLLSGTVMAYMFRITGDVNNQFEPAVVSCKVSEEFNGTQKTQIMVQNTGNVAAYLRLRLVSYWVDGSGNIVAKPSEMPTFALNSGWVAGSNDTYYYTAPVDPEGFSGVLSTGAITLKIEGDTRQVLEVFAEAIQSNPTAAVTDSWNVTLDGSGNITAAP